MEPLLRYVEVARDGAVWGAAHFGPDDTGSKLLKGLSSGERLQVLDLAIAEFTTSIVRLAAHLWRVAEVAGDAHLFAALDGRAAFEIASLDPAVRRWLAEGEANLTPSIESGIVGVPADDLYESPDAIARRLLTRMFAWAGAERWRRYGTDDRFVPPS